MVYDLEDEVDWSDGSLGPCSPFQAPAIPHITASDSTIEEPNKQTNFFLPEPFETEEVPSGVPLSLDSVTADRRNPYGLSRVQRVKAGLHSNRRVPTKETFSHFALYQANQKTYEAMFLKTFIAHALHPDQLNECFYGKENAALEIEKYLRSVSSNVTRIANKMIRNAHSRVVNIFANDSKTSVPFLDITQFRTNLFSDFGPRNAVSVDRRMMESWHRALEDDAMVQYSPKDYPIGGSCSPLEEIDEVANRLFNEKTFGKPLGTGRIVKQPVKKNKGRGLPGAAHRKNQNATPRRNWLPSVAYPVARNEPEPQKPIAESPISSKVLSTTQSDTRNGPFFAPYLKYANPIPTADLHSEMTTTNAELTQLERRSDLYGRNAPMSDSESIQVEYGEVSPIEKVPTWREKLIDDHKRRLTAKWGSPQQHSHKLLLDIKSIIGREVTKAFLVPPTREVQERIDTTAAQEKENTHLAHPSAVQNEITASVTNSRNDVKSTPQSAVANFDGQIEARVQREKHFDGPVGKRRKTVPSASRIKQSAEGPLKKNFSKVDSGLGGNPALPTHSSGSRTLEPHQVLPPGAYFERTSKNEKPAWRCGIKHAMGYYYNAGDRKNCPGCFTSVNQNVKIQWMDFYMPFRSHFHQPALGVIWKPSKQLIGKARRCTHLSHNSIAKDAYWTAINKGTAEDEARKKGVEAVEEHLQPKPHREHTPQPTPEPEPEPIDLGPHPSGSSKMEHGLDIPKCHYFDKKERHEEFAWRCDVNHALGRYYLAGDKKTCPGCGSNKSGVGKQATMDFYLPSGTTVRQEAPMLVSWKPRKPYKTRRVKSHKEKQMQSHNQICSKKYWEYIEAGLGHARSLEMAIESTDAELDAREEHTRKKQAEEMTKIAKFKRIQKSKKRVKSSDDTEFIDAHPEITEDGDRRNSEGGVIVSLAPMKRKFEDLSDREQDEVEEYCTGQDTEAEGAGIIEISSEAESSDSDSE